jgi:hypothetical protein
MKVGTKFKIGYKAKSIMMNYLERGYLDRRFRIWTDKSGQAIFTYYDVEREGYRSATNDVGFHFINS